MERSSPTRRRRPHPRIPRTDVAVTTPGRRPAKAHGSRRPPKTDLVVTLLQGASVVLIVLIVLVGTVLLTSIKTASSSSASGIRLRSSSSSSVQEPTINRHPQPSLMVASQPSLSSPDYHRMHAPPPPLRKNKVEINVLDAQLDEWDRHMIHGSSMIDQNQSTRIQRIIPASWFVGTNKTSESTNALPDGNRHKFSRHGRYYRTSRRNVEMQWQKEWKAILESKEGPKGPLVDYTQWNYEYPILPRDVPQQDDHDVYPPLQNFQSLFERWPQDDIDHPPNPIQEVLYHFDYTNATQLEKAAYYRDVAKLPFKLVNVPDVVAAGHTWTDDYIARNFDDNDKEDTIPKSQGKCQESIDNFFLFYHKDLWNVPDYGVPPTRNNDWTFATFAQHARYADHVRLPPHHGHYYWQSGVSAQERFVPSSQWTFVSRDLPSLSSPNATVLSPHPSEQKGIQCRFGERGVVAALHYDGGRNMVAVVRGAKRYILAPPNQCRQFGIHVTAANSSQENEQQQQQHPLYRHSPLNLGRILDDRRHLTTTEGKWLHRARSALVLETVVQAGQVLYIPSHWFHYIISLQANAQCNVRSGVDETGHPHFGGMRDVLAEQCTLVDV